MVTQLRTGRKRIKLRLILFLAIVSIAVACFIYVFLIRAGTNGIEREGDYFKVDLKALGAFPLDPANGTLTDIPSRLRELDGKRVALQGYMWAPDAGNANDVNHFQVVENMRSFNPEPPRVQDRVYATVPGNGTVPYCDQARVFGTLHVDVVKNAGIICSVYTLDVEKVELP